MGRRAGRLTVRERRFIDAYLGSCSGNASAAVRVAGYGARTQKSQQTQGSKLLSKSIVRTEIDKRLAKSSTESIATAEERDRILTKIARMPMTELHAIISAVKELNKCSGRHSIRHVMDVTEKLADIIAASRG